MRVIDIGKIGEHNIQCKGCYAELAYFPADIKLYCGNEYKITYVKCPVCGIHIMLTKEENPWRDIID